MVDEPVDNRSEVVFLYDAVRTNPNGNPMSAENEPRVDSNTNRAIVTDVRLKRYIRDQLDDDGHGVYIKDLSGQVSDRDYLVEDILPDGLKDNLKDADDIESLEEGSEVLERLESSYELFLDNAADVRMFGATFSYDGESDVIEMVDDYFPSSAEGPMQFMPARSLNTVEHNDEYDSLTSVVTTGKDKQQGGFDLADNRLRYALFPFGGVVNENAAEDTRLTQDDVRRLDTLLWRALKNQTLTRSKVGQNPRLYMRVEYETDSYHVGALQEYLELDEENTEDVNALRSSSQVVVDMSKLVDVISERDDHVQKVHVVGDPLLRYSVGDTVMDSNDFFEHLRGLGVEVREVDVASEALETLPDQ